MGAGEGTSRDSLSYLSNNPSCGNSCAQGEALHAHIPQLDQPVVVIVRVLPDINIGGAF